VAAFVPAVDERAYGGDQVFDGSSGNEVQVGP